MSDGPGSRRSSAPVPPSARDIVRSASLDRQVVELDDRVGLGPEPDFSRFLERPVLRVEDLLAVEPDGEVVAPRIQLQRVPRVRRNLDRLVLELSLIHI